MLLNINRWKSYELEYPPSPLLSFRCASLSRKRRLAYKDGRGAALLHSVYLCIKPSLRKWEEDAYCTRIDARKPQSSRSIRSTPQDFGSVRYLISLGMVHVCPVISRLSHLCDIKMIGPERKTARIDQCQNCEPGSNSKN